MQMLGFDDPTEMSEGGVGLAGILHSLRRRWLMVCLLGLPLAAAATYAGWRTTKTEYIARAVIRFNDTFNPMQSDRQGNPKTASGLDDRATQLQLITAPDVLSSALDRRGIGQLSVLNDVVYRTAWLEERVRATFPGDSDVMHLTVRCTNEEAAKALTNAILKAYLANVKDQVTDEKKHELKELETLEEELETEIGDGLDRLHSWGVDEQRSGRGLSLNEQMLLTQWNTVANELRSVNELISRAEELRKEADDAPASDAAEDNTANSANGDAVDGGVAPDATETPGPPEVFVSDAELTLAENQDGDISRYKQAIEGLQHQIKEARRLLVEAKAQDYIDEFEARIELYRQKIEDRKIEVHDAIILRKRLEESGDAGLTLNELNARKQRLESELKDIKAAMPQQEPLTPTAYLEIPLVQDQINSARDLLQEVKNQIRDRKLAIAHDEEVKALRDAEKQKRSAETGIQSADARADNDWDVPPELTLIDTARVTPGEAERRRMMKCGGIGFLSFLAWAGLVVGWDFRRQRLNSPIDVSKTLQLRVLGVVPLLKHRKRRNMQQSERFAEAVDGISAALLCGTTGDDHRILLISSALAGEGKTTLAANLASSLANAGRKTLLLDFDLRRPMLHRVYDIEVDPGVSEVLVGESSVAEAIHDLDDSNLKLLTAGRWRQRSLSHLTDQNVARLFQQLREQFDFVVVDASPILPAVDTRIIARHVDGVVLSMLRDVSETPKVRAACEVLNSFSANILGAVMIGASADLYYGYPLSSSRKRA